MASAGVVYVDVNPDLSRFGSQLRTGLMPAFSSFARVAGGLLAGIGLTRFFSSAIDEAREAAKVSAQTEAVIKSTGGAANVSAGQVDQLAESLSRKVGIDDEAIATGENLLLTFTNIRNETGKGNDIFNQATKAVVDMSAAMDQDLKSSAIQVGKALNDPIKGVTALQRVGVTFTDGQKDMIKTLVESGDVLGAQKIILAELTKEFGGSAKALADPFDKLSVAWGNLQEQVGTALAPILTSLSNLALDLIGAFGEDGLSGVLRVLWERFTNLSTPVKIAIGVLLGVAAAMTLVAIAGAVASAVTALGAAFALLASPIGLVILAVAALVAGVIYAYTHFESFRNIVDSVAAFFVDTVWPKLQQFGQYIVEQWQNLVNWTREHWAQISEAVNNVVTVISTVVGAFIAAIVLAWNTFGDELVEQARNVWDFIRGIVEAAVDIIRGIITVFLAILTLDFATAWEGIRAIFEGVWEAIKAIVQLALDTIVVWIQVAWDAIKLVTETIWLGILALLGGIWELIKALVQGAVDFVRSVIELAWNVIKGITEAIWTGITSFISGAWELIKGIVSGALSAVVSFIQAAWDTAVQVVTGALLSIISAVFSGLETVVGFFVGLPGDILDALGSLGTLLIDVGRALMEGLLQGIREAAEAVWDFVSGIAGKILSLKGPMPYDKILLVHSGELIMEGLQTGLAKGWTGVEHQLSAYTAGLPELAMAGAAIDSSPLHGAADALIGAADYMAASRSSRVPYRRRPSRAVLAGRH